jgi:hypothetical protein
VPTPKSQNKDYLKLEQILFLSKECREHVTEYVKEYVTEYVPEYVPEYVIEHVTEYVIEHVTEKAGLSRATLKISYEI